MIRILHVTKELGSGGIESMICNLYHHIDREKIQFDFAIHTNEHGMHENEVLELGARVYRFRNLTDIKGVHRYKRQWYQFFANEGQDYVIIHLHYMSHEGMIAEIASKYGKKIIAHSHSTIPNHQVNIKTIVSRWVNRNLSKNATLIMACSRQAGFDFFGEIFGEEGTVLKNAIDIEKYQYDIAKRKKMRMKHHLEDKFVIGHVGNYVGHKNQDFMILIFSEVVKCIQNAVLVWCGNIHSPDKQHIEKMIEELQIQDKVVLTGRCDCVNDWMQAFDVFLFPSLYEGLGIVLIEAQACGLPCIISDTIPEEVEITDLIYRCKLTESPEKWAKVLKTNSIDAKRRQKKEELTGGGYDVNVTSSYIEELYVQLITN